MKMDFGYGRNHAYWIIGLHVAYVFLVIGLYMYGGVDLLWRSLIFFAFLFMVVMNRVTYYYKKRYEEG